MLSRSTQRRLPRPAAFLVPLYLIGREELPASINEMDMPEVTDVPAFPSCSIGSATPLASLITSLYTAD